MLFCTGSLCKIAHFEKCVSSFLFPLRLIDQLSFTIMITSLFPSIPSPATYLKRGPRGFRRRSKSGRKRPGGGQRQRRSCRVSYFANQKAPRVDRAQFLLALHVSRGRRIVLGSCRSLPSRGSVRRNMPWYRVI